GDGDGDMGGAGGGGSVDDFEPIDEVFSGKVAAVDELSGVSIGENGKVYASGTKLVNTGTDEDPVDDVHTAVVRFNADGSLDSTFGDAGVLLLNLRPVDGDAQEVTDRAGPGRESTRSIVALDDGGAVVSVNMNDGTGNGGGVTALYRVDASGDAVTSFGTDGLASVPLTDWTAASTGWDTAEGNPTDTVWDIQLDTSGDEDRIVAFGYAPAPMSTTRMDNDRYVVRINLDDGSFDTSFADAGSFSIDFGEHNLSEGTRRGVVLPNGEIISSGSTVIGDFRHHIMLLRLDETGAPATDFGFIAGDS